MSFDVEEKKYLRVHHGTVVTIEEVKTSEWKGKKSIVVVLKDSEGYLIDGKFKLPLSENKNSEYLLKALFKAVNKPYDVKACPSLVGEKVAIQVSKNDWQGKFYFAVTSYAPASYIDSSIEVGTDGGHEDLEF